MGAGEVSGGRWTALRCAFVVSVAVGAWLSWRNSGNDVRHALHQLDTAPVVVAGALIFAGLVTTANVWKLALAAFGIVGSLSQLAPPFFVAQLGKYIPGSVWSFAAQAVLGRENGLAPRVAATSSALFLGVHVASGLLMVGFLGWFVEMSNWLVLGCFVLGIAGLAPAVLRTLGTHLAGEPCGWDLRRSVLGLCLMVPTWLSYAVALAVLAPPVDVERTVLMGTAFAVAHAVGVAIPLAPAGLGAREATLILLLGSDVGVGRATVIALVSRLMHFVADFVVAAGSWLILHRSATGRAPKPVKSRP